MTRYEIIIAVITVLFMLLTMVVYFDSGMDAMQGIGNILLALIFQQLALDKGE